MFNNINESHAPRKFAWRIQITPYKILIAEIMLQRTRADQVEPIYKTFIKKYPSIKSLAKANNKEIAKYTIHLGIHWRAKKNIISCKIYNK